MIALAIPADEAVSDMPVHHLPVRLALWKKDDTSYE